MTSATSRRNGKTALMLGLGCALLCSGCDRQWVDRWTAAPVGATAATEPSQWTRQATVHAQGSLQPSGGVLRMMGTPGDRIEQVLVEAGQNVEAGERLVVLASDRTHQEELRLLDQRIAEAEQAWEHQVAEADEAVHQARRALQQAELARRHAAEQTDLVRQAERAVDTARRPLQRLEQAAADPATRSLVTPTDLDRQRLATEQAEQQWRQSSLVAQQAHEMAEIAVEMSQRQVTAAEQMRDRLNDARALDVLRQQRVVLETRMQIARILSPIAARVLRVEANPGDSVGQLPLVELADVAQMHCYAEVHEADAPRLALGQSAQMQSPALPQPLRGKVQRIDSVVGRPQLRPPNPLAPVDFRSIGVTIALDSDSAALAAHWIHLQVDVTIETPPLQPQPAAAADTTVTKSPVP